MIMFAGPEVVNIPFNPILATSDSLKVEVAAGAGTGKISLDAQPYQDTENQFLGIVTPPFMLTPK